MGQITCDDISTSHKLHRNDENGIALTECLIFRIGNILVFWKGFDKNTLKFSDVIIKNKCGISKV